MESNKDNSQNKWIEDSEFCDRFLVIHESVLQNQIDTQKALETQKNIEILHTILEPFFPF